MKNNTPNEPQSWNLLLILSIALIVFAAGFLFTQYSEKKADMYIFPEGFRGVATVFFSDSEGTAEERNGEKRIFRIPQSGILRTQAIYKDKWSNFYYKNPDGTLRQLMYGDARIAGGSITYSNIDSVWVQEMNIIELDTLDRKVTLATITVKRN